jgi:CTP:molybdopterin cytidylyltransferase MocA
VSAEIKIAAVVLAAGASRRLGRPKQQVVLGGETLVERAVRVAMEARLAPVIAVVAEAALLEPLQRMGAIVLLNHKAHEGMSTSIHVGVKWALGVAASGAVVMTCDQVAVTPEHLRALCAEPQRVTASAYAGRKGVPAYFPAAEFETLMKLQGDAGARELLRVAAAVQDESLALDVDTVEDLAKAQLWLTGSSGL